MEKKRTSNESRPDETSDLTALQPSNPTATFVRTSIVLAGALILLLSPRLVRASGCPTAGFAAQTVFSAGSGPTSVAVGDFDGDGKLDLAVVDDPVPGTASSGVSILLGNGTGGFGTPTQFAAGSRPLSAAVGDLNGDGKLDL